MGPDRPIAGLAPTLGPSYNLLKALSAQGDLHSGMDGVQRATSVLTALPVLSLSAMSVTSPS
jgi:hypothetical protein